MALKCGIVGLPNVGKSTLFNCISSGKAQSANFPFCTIEPNLGSTSVPDKRLEVLADMCKPQRVIPATVDIVDIAGLVKGASKGEGLGNQFLANIRETDAILHVLRCFDDGNVVHVDGSVDPVRDKEVVDTELQIKDLETVESRLAKVLKQAQTGGDKEARKIADLLLRYKAALEQGKSCRSVPLVNEEEEAIAHDLFLLTNKKVMYVCNVDDASAVNGNAYVDAVREAVKEENAEILIISAKTESEIAEMESYEDRQMFLEEMGLQESGAASSIRTSKRGSSAQKSSSMMTMSPWAAKVPPGPQESCPRKERTMSSRTATSCTSSSTSDAPPSPSLTSPPAGQSLLPDGFPAGLRTVAGRVAR